MLFSSILCAAAVVGSVVALPTSGLQAREEEYTGAGGVSILNGVELPAKREEDYTGAGGVSILNGAELPAKREEEYTGAGGVSILNGVELPARH